ncbi:hypothetical protein J2X56_004894 [Herbaspirillum sp. 1173]|uniref:succinylglutamate desuccinylase/aspartoacylase domain-containing protein n=1 Tax=Herbaspirillum sp. 1173 TaxID=2817734 RepID=UPI002858EB89|nr:succinylglutamate desuccinylase/aspartoacylase family protein [Herbaspirillum sp. 1173]MDR6742859.1 hypothetical protein [Herbaspirillum sp. 1173]
MLLEGGNHGDEYEGPIALGELIRTLRSEDINGRLIIVPAINTPAVDAGHRTSPVDGKNMNRVFPGDHAGTITEQIAAFVNDELISRSDALLSLHSGGSSLEIIPSTIIQPSDNADQFERCKLAASRFGAPVCVVMDTLASLFPADVRSTGVSIAYNLAVTLFGGFSSLIATWLINFTGSPLAPVWYVAFAACLAVAGSFMLPALRDKEISPIN